MALRPVTADSEPPSTIDEAMEGELCGPLTMVVPPRSEAYVPPPPRLNRHQRRMAQAKARKGGVR